ncbi:hypothetical protein GQ600_670 [Phytophthora cactorum]|nr:hypothetical protein GQ600_9054 [Phytophthora cactorum]KAF1789194.1 hypothetical protein GQ600_670 [Phytophthora cactorum]
MAPNREICSFLFRQ